MSISSTTSAACYAAVAATLHARGWEGVMPLPPGKKWPPPDGYTGRDGADPSMDDVLAWSAERPDANVALRMPRGVLGLDVDAHGDKPGGETLALLEQECGPLPPAPTTTSRDDGVSGIRLYRVPEDYQAVSALPGIETIQRHHRYAIVAPSTHPDTGRTYRWLGTGEPTPPDALPELPAAWLDRLRAGSASTAKANLAPTETAEALAAYATGGEPDARVNAALGHTTAALYGAGSRHEAARDGVGVLVRLGERGHPGVGAALATLHRTFEAATDHRDPGEWTRLVDGAVALVAASPTEAAEARAERAAAEAEFWATRPELVHIRRFAQARMVSPWAVLGVVLARVVAATPYSAVLPPIVGGRASLNLAVGLVGPSGGGKGAAEAVARDALSFINHKRFPDHFVTHKLGSGQGLAHGYVHWDKTTNALVRHADACLFVMHEVDQLVGLSGQRGSTLLPELRSALMGEALGYLYADPTRRLMVPEHEYRLALVIGIQPARAGVLLDDADGGTPQRLVWLPTTDPESPTTLPAEPSPLIWSVPHWPTAPLAVCEPARAAIVAARDAQLRGHGDPLDGHRLLLREKLAAALDLLAGRAEVSAEAWELAGVIMRVSDRTRGECLRVLADKARAANLARAEQEATRAAVVAATAEEAALQRTADRLLWLLGDGEWHSRSELRGRLRSNFRGLFEEAAAQLLAEGRIEARKTAYRGQEADEYRAL